MFDRFVLLLVSLFCIAASFFVGLYFGRDTIDQELSDLRKDLQVSLQVHGNIIEVEKSDPSIRVLINGKIVTNSGSFSVPK